MEKIGEETKRRVVVIGGGVAGSLFAKSIQFVSDVTLIDPKEYYEITWASLRAMVEPSFGERSVINHRDYLTNGWLVTSPAVDITDDEVITGEGRRIGYDYLVIATGTCDSLPKTKVDRLAQYKAENEMIESSSSILIVGGGPTGVELAGEIATDYPEKKVTLVHDGPRLLEFIGQNASDKALNWLLKKKVEVRLDRTVDLSSISEKSKSYRILDSEIINADCHFLCTGKSLGSQWLQQTILKNNLDNNGRLMVDENLRVKGRKNIFAIGDITDIQNVETMAGNKTGYHAQKHAMTAAKNMKILMEGGKESKMEKYKAGGKKVIVSLGRKEAVAQFPLTTTIGALPGLIKSRDLFVSKIRKQLGLHPHTSHLYH